MTVEVLQGSSFTDLAHCQRTFDLWRDIYNLERPHDALDLATPATKYQVSQRLFPEVLPPLEYEPTDLVRRVHDKGRLQLFGRIFKVPKPESTEGGRRVSVLRRQEGAPVLLG